MHKECQLRLKLKPGNKRLTVQRLGSVEPKVVGGCLVEIKLTSCRDNAAVLLQLTCWNCRVPLNVILFYLATICGVDIIVSGWVLLPTTV